VSSASSAPVRRRLGPPWGLAIAAGLLLLLELVLRLMNPRGVLPATMDRELAYRAVVPELLGFGAPDVAIIGSSRARRAVLAPALRSALGRKRGRVSVGNFALGGAESEEIEAAVRRLLETSPPPRLLVWPISPREFEPRTERPVKQVGYLWRVPDWARARKALGAAADAHLPNAVRNELARHSYVIRYRFATRDLVEDRPRRWRRDLFDVLTGERGEATLHGAIDPKFKSKSKNKVMEVDQDRVEKFIGRAYEASDWPRNYQSEHFRAALGVARARKVPVLLVELPLHPTLEAAFPPRTVERFRSFVEETARREGAAFVALERLDVRFVLTDFQEHSHVNYRGAQKYTNALTPIVRAHLEKAPKRDTR
jgi:hypothetical protein